MTRRGWSRWVAWVCVTWPEDPWMLEDVPRALSLQRLLAALAVDFDARRGIGDVGATVAAWWTTYELPPGGLVRICELQQFLGIHKKHRRVRRLRMRSTHEADDGLKTRLATREEILSWLEDEDRLLTSLHSDVEALYRV